MNKRTSCPECNGTREIETVYGADPERACHVWELCSRCGGSGRLCPVGALLEGYLASAPSDWDAAAVELAAALLAAPQEHRNGASPMEHREVERHEAGGLPDAFWERVGELLASRPGLAKAAVAAAKAVAS